MLRLLFASKWLVLCLTFLVLEGVIVVSEFFVLFHASEQILADASEILPYCIAVVALALLNLLTGGLVSTFREYWRLQVVARLLDLGVRNVDQRLDIYQDNELRQTRPTVAVTNGYLISENFVGYTVDLVRSLILYVASLIAIFIFIDESITLPFLLSLAVTFFTAKKLMPYTSNLSEEIEELRGKVGTHYAGKWDNVVLSNNVWKKRWLEEFSRIFNHYCGLEKKRAIVTYLIQVLHTLIPYVLVLSFLAFYLLGNSTEAILAALILLPKVISALHTQSNMLFYVGIFGLARGQVKALLETLSRPEEQAYKERIDWAKIKFSNFGMGKDAAMALQGVLNRCGGEPGQVHLITGENGSGKTTFLLGLKEQFLDEATFIPAVARDIQHDGCVNVSTGQKHFSLLEQTLKQDSSNIILLDEWDAHLDAIKVSSIESLIESCAASGKFIIQIRHKVVQ